MRRLPFFILAFALLAVSCRKAAPLPAEVAATAPLREAYHSVGSRYGAWYAVYMPVHLSLESPSQFSISGRALLVPDSLIYMSLRKLGMEVAVLNIDCQRAVLLDKFHKIYISEPWPESAPDSLLSLRTLQSALLGRPWAAADCWKGYVADSLLSATALRLGDYAGIDFFYSDFCATPCGPVPALVRLNATSPFFEASACIEWQPEKADWDSDRRPAVRIPDDYKRVDAAALLRLLSNTSE